MAQLRNRIGITAWHSACFDKRDVSGNLRHITASPADPPRKTGANGSAAWDMNSANYYLELPNPITDYFTSTVSMALVSFLCHSVTSNAAAAEDNEALLGESLDLPGGGGIYLRNNGSESRVVGRVGSTEASRHIDMEKWYVVIFAFDGARGRVDLAIEPFDFFANPNGPSSASYGAAVPLIGRNHAGLKCDADIAEVILFNDFRDDILVAKVWNFMAARVTRRGDPEEQMRDLMTRRAILSDRLSYMATGGRDQVSLSLAGDLALTHRLILTSDGNVTGPDQWARYESTIMRKEIDADEQLVDAEVIERHRIIAVASGRPDRVGSDMDGSLLMGARLTAATPVAPIGIDRTVNKCIPLRSTEPKMDEHGWYCETGGAPLNSVFADALAAPWTAAGGAVREVIPPDVPVLFDSTILVADTKVPASIRIPDGGSLVLAQDFSLSDVKLPYLRFFYIGDGTVEAANDTEFWDWTANSGAGGWTGGGPFTLALATVDSWTEFIYGPLVNLDNVLTVTWRAGGGQELRLGYASADANAAIIATDNAPTAATAVGQFHTIPGEADDIDRVYLPLVSPFAGDGCIRFRFEPLWHQSRMPATEMIGDGEVANRILILRIGPFDPGADSTDVVPEYRLIFDVTNARLELINVPLDLMVSVACAGANVWVPGVKNLITVGWSYAGIPPFAAQTILLSVDGRQSAAQEFGAPFTGTAPMLLTAQAPVGNAITHPNGIYSDFILSSRPGDATKTRVLEFEP